jgi:hypothetical protein
MRKRFVEAVILVVHRRYKIRKQFRLAARFIARQDFRGRGRQTTITNMPPFLRFSLARLKNQHNLWLRIVNCDPNNHQYYRTVVVIVQSV